MHKEELIDIFKNYHVTTETGGVCSLIGEIEDCSVLVVSVNHGNFDTTLGVHLDGDSFLTERTDCWELTCEGSTDPDGKTKKTRTFRILTKPKKPKFLIVNKEKHC